MAVSTLGGGRTHATNEAEPGGEVKEIQGRGSTACCPSCLSVGLNTHAQNVQAVRGWAEKASAPLYSALDAALCTPYSVLQAGLTIPVGRKKSR